MSTVNAKLQIGYIDNAWITANPTFKPDEGQLVYNSDTGDLFIGNNVTLLTALTAINGGGIDVGTSPVLNATNGYILYNNNGTLGEVQTSGTGAVLLASSLNSYVPYSGATGAVNLGSQNLYTNGNISVGRSNPDRPIEVYSSTGNATMQSYTAFSSGVAGYYSQADNLANYIGIIQAGTTWTTNGLRQADSSWIEAAGDILAIYNYNVSGDVVIATGGFATANEKIRLSPTVTTFKGNTINFDNGTASRLLATDASKNLQYLNTSTYPSLTELSYVKGVTSAVQTQIDKQLFTTSHFHGAPQTIGTTALFFNAYPTGNGIAGASGGVGVTIIPFDCTLVGFSLSIKVFGTLGTANNATVYVRVNNTTDITLSSSVLYSAATSTYSSAALNTDLNAGDYVEIKIVPNCTPTAATSVAENVTLYYKPR